MNIVKAQVYYDFEKLAQSSIFSEELDIEDIHFRLNRVETELSTKFNTDEINIDSVISNDGKSLIITIESNIPKDNIIDSLQTTISDLELFGKILND